MVAISVLTLFASQTAAQAVEYSAQPDPQLSWKPNGRVYDILTVGDTVYLAGKFTSLRNLVTGQSVGRTRLAAYNRVTGELLSWNPAANDTVRSLAAGDGNVIYAGGSFTAVGGASRTRVAAITAATDPLLPTGLVLPFNASASAEVRDLVVSGGALYLSGAFATVDGVSRRAVAKVDAVTGVLDPVFNAKVGSGRVYALGLTAGGLVIGGNFNNLNAAPARFLAALSPDTGAALPFAPPVVCDTCQILDLDIDGDSVYAATGGGGGGRVAKWSLTTSERVWVRRGDGDVQAIDVYDGVVYAGGHFGPDFEGQLRHQFVALTTDGTVLPMVIAFTGLDHPGIWAVDADAQGLRLGGGFQSISGSAAARFAVFPTVVPPPPPPTT